MNNSCQVDYVPIAGRRIGLLQNLRESLFCHPCPNDGAVVTESEEHLATARICDCADGLPEGEVDVFNGSLHLRLPPFRERGDVLGEQLLGGLSSRQPPSESSPFLEAIRNHSRINREPVSGQERCGGGSHHPGDPEARRLASGFSTRLIPLPFYLFASLTWTQSRS